MASNDDAIRRILMELLSDPMNLPSTFWDYATQSWLKDAPVFPISQVFGFTQFTAQRASKVGQSTTTSATPGNLGDGAGPTLTLADGNYLFIVQAYVFTSNTTFAAFMGPSLNGSTPDATTALITSSTAGITCLGVSTGALNNNGNNTVTAQYWIGGGATGTYQYRNLVALKYSNL